MDGYISELQLLDYMDLSHSKLGSPQAFGAGITLIQTAHKVCCDISVQVGLKDQEKVEVWRSVKKRRRFEKEW